MSLKDIEKLKEKVDKDPNSKLFVPLAEEYRKEGMLDDAISVLLKGIEKQPGYMSARVSLGKIYLEKGMSKEARGEFENVIKSIPDNLYAHKKLAEIYRDTGERDLSINSYRSVLKLNAMDEDALSNLRDLEGGEKEFPLPEEGPSVEPAVMDMTPTEEPPIFEDQSQGTSHSDIMSPTVHAERLGEEAHPGDELSAFKDSLFGGKTDEPGGVPEEAPAEEEEAIEIMDEQAEEEFSFGDINEILKSDASHIKEAPGAVYEEIPAKPASEEITGEIFDEGKAFDAGAAVSVDTGMTFDNADRQISEGNYSGAMNIYKGMLSSNPDDKKTLQRIEDLRTLLKLMGRDKEELISRLNTFLEGIKKRRDEFFGSS